MNMRRRSGGRGEARRQAYEARADEGAESRSARRSVLVLDDEPRLLVLWRHIGEILGVEVTGVATVAQARAVLAAERVDQVVCDWFLAGEETSQPLAEDLRAAGVPVLVTSGDITFLAGLAALYPTLAKPFGLRDVEAVLRVGAAPVVARRPRTRP